MNAVVDGRIARLALPAATVLGGAVAAGVVWFAEPASPHGFPLLPCPFKLLTGLDCPACGGTRMVFSLLHGDLAVAVHYNALAVVLIPFVLWAWGGWVAGRWRGLRVRTWQHWRWTPTVLLAVLAAWTLVRNLALGPLPS